MTDTYISNLKKISTPGTLVGWVNDGSILRRNLTVYDLDEKGTCNDVEKTNDAMVVLPKFSFVRASGWVNDSMFVVVLLPNGRIYATMRSWLKAL